MKGGRDTLGLVVGRSLGLGSRFQPPSPRTANIAAMSLTPSTPIGHPLGVWLGCLLGIVVIGAIDAATGFELSMSIFYVALCRWMSVLNITHVR